MVAISSPVPLAVEMMGQATEVGPLVPGAREQRELSC